MDKKTSLLLKNKLKEYYFNNIENVEIPHRLNEREIGFMTFDKTMVRHLSFENPGDLRAMIIKNAPHSIYYSTSFYSEPSLPMNEKGWKGSELVFDIDADMLNSSCKAEHDRWECKECGKKRIGIRPKKCPKCGKNRIHEINITCDQCLNLAKKETIKLINILSEDFGLDQRNMDVYFSGNMGYHVSISSDIFFESNQFARNEIVDYVSGRSFIPESIGVYKNSNYDQLIKDLPSNLDKGWKGRLGKYVLNNMLCTEKTNDLRIYLADLYIEKGYKKFRTFLQQTIQKCASRVDPSVTTDIHRILRLPGTIHGKTGLLKIKCEDINQFNPLIDAVAFGNDLIKIYVNHSPRISIGGEVFGPFKNKKVNVPMCAAIYLLGLEFARVEEN